MADRLLTDLALAFRPDGSVDLALGARDVGTTSGTDNLTQAILLRLLIRRGELAGLGHRPYGSRVYELIGEPLDAANLGLLRRLVRRAIEEDPRVREVRRVTVTPRRDVPGVVVVEAAVIPISGEDEVRVEVELDVG